MLALFVAGLNRRIIKAFSIALLFTVPFWGIIYSRFSSGGTAGDLLSFLNGGIEMYAFEHTSDATMTYRLAWVYERIVYLLSSPISEQFFGLGLVSDGSPLSKAMYDFYFKISFPSITMQLRTPDIAYATIMAYYGFGGCLIYFSLIISIICYFYLHRKSNVFFLASAAVMIVTLVEAFATDKVSNPQWLALYFLIISLVRPNKTTKFFQNAYLIHN